jgi:hypothetical protein
MNAIPKWVHDIELQANCIDVEPTFGADAGPGLGPQSPSPGISETGTVLLWTSVGVGVAYILVKLLQNAGTETASFTGRHYQQY